MKRFLLLVAALLCVVSAQAQSILRNSLNTNSLGTNLVWNPSTLRLRASGATPSIELWNTSGTANFRRFLFNNATDQLRVEWSNDNGSSSLLLSTWSSDGNFAPVTLSLSGETNRLSIVNDQLLLDGQGIGGGAGVTNIYDTTIITNNFFVTGKGATLIMTNYVRFPWTTLTMSGSNVSTIDLSVGSAFKLLLTNNAFFGAPTGLPGTNQAQTIYIHLLQDGTGVRTVTMTNAAWHLAGSGESTNQVPTITTNANGETILTFVTSPISAAKLKGVPTAFAP